MQGFVFADRTAPVPVRLFSSRVDGGCITAGSTITFRGGLCLDSDSERVLKDELGDDALGPDQGAGLD